MQFLEELKNDVINERETHNNRLYGHDKILKLYAGVDMSEKIDGVITHGWYPNSGVPGYIPSKPKKGRNRDKFYSRKFLTWNKRMVSAGKRLGFENTIGIGSPFLYMPKIEPTESLGPMSLILFPYHSTEQEPFHDAVENYKVYLEQIKDEIIAFDPVTICLGENEYTNDGIRNLLKDYDVVTLGNNEKSDFLIRYQELVNKYAYVSSNIFSTAVFYGLHMGKESFILGEPKIDDRKFFEWKAKDFYNMPKKFAELYPEILWENFKGQWLIGIADIELGLEYKKSPEALKEIIYAQK